MDKLDMENIVKAIFELKKEKEIIDNQLIDFKSKATELDNQIKAMSTELLEGMKSFDDIKEFEVDNIIASRYQRETIGYTSENDVLAYLKENYKGQYINTKVIETLDKNPLKKAVKTDDVLAKALESMTIKTITEYVVVTDVENHQKMLEHIKESKN